MGQAAWFPNGVDAAPIDKNRYVITTANTTLTAADSGKTYVFRSGTIIFSLPATTPGVVYGFLYAGDNGKGQLQISPVAADGIAAAGSAVLNKDLIITTANLKKGDYVLLGSGVGTTGVTAWHVMWHRGIITKEA